MGKIVVEKKSYNCWGNCIRVTNGEIELYATVDFGPRIIKLGRVDGPNVFFEDTQKSFSTNDGELDFFGKGEKWYIYGGHRLWHSPESMPRSYLPENSPVEYELLENGVRLVPSAQEKLGTQNEIVVTMAEDGTVTLLHKVTNIGAWDIELAPWALTVMAHGGVEVVPMSDRDAGLLSNRNLILWPYTKINDHRVKWDDKYVMLSTDNNPELSNFKIGINNEDGFAMYFNNNDLFVKRFDYDEAEIYPDGGCNFETFTNDKFIECESIAPLCILEPGDTATHTEVWNYYIDVEKPANAEEAKKAVEKFIK